METFSGLTSAEEFVHFCMRAWVPFALCALNIFNPCCSARQVRVLLVANSYGGGSDITEPVSTSEGGEGWELQPLVIPYSMGVCVWKLPGSAVFRSE